MGKELGNFRWEKTNMGLLLWENVMKQRGDLWEGINDLMSGLG